MCKGLMDFMKCAGVGLIVGTAVGAIFCCKSKEKSEKRFMKRKARKALEAIEDMMGEVQDVFVKRH